MTREPISRRRALALLGLGGAGVAVGASGWAIDPGPWSAAGPGFQAALTGAALVQPPVLDSRDAALEVELTAAPGVRLAGRDTSAWGYNHGSPGPTLRLRAGDTLRVRLVNRLDQPTNLHTHGLHVPFGANADNPFLTVDPGSHVDYEIPIPADHPPGTYWYHPHHHGVVADQIFAGLVGAILIDGGPDLPVAGDELLLVTDTTMDSAGHVVGVDALARTMGREGELVLVNGQHQPVLRARTGTARRWRIVNACTSRVLDLRLTGHRVTQIALDGAYLPAPLDRDRIVLAPGNRADLIVAPGTAGEYTVVSEAYDRGRPSMMGGARATSTRATLATLVVSGPPAAAPPLPTALPAPARADDRVTGRRQLTLGMGMGMGMAGGMGFTIDGRTFDPARNDMTVHRGTTEEWTIVNTSPMVHPFHLHGWPMRVLAASDGAAPVGLGQDVVLVPARGWVRVRVAFTDFAGRTVYHCHILDHEDLGMMGTVNVLAG